MYIYVVLYIHIHVYTSTILTHYKTYITICICLLLCDNTKDAETRVSRPGSSMVFTRNMSRCPTVLCINVCILPFVYDIHM